MPNNKETLTLAVKGLLASALVVCLLTFAGLFASLLVASLDSFTTALVLSFLGALTAGLLAVFRILPKILKGIGFVHGNKKWKYWLSRSIVFLVAAQLFFDEFWYVDEGAFIFPINSQKWDYDQCTYNHGFGRAINTSRQWFCVDDSGKVIRYTH